MSLTEGRQASLGKAGGHRERTPDLLQRAGAGLVGRTSLGNRVAGWVGEEDGVLPEHLLAHPCLQPGMSSEGFGPVDGTCKVFSGAEGHSGLAHRL